MTNPDPYKYDPDNTPITYSTALKVAGTLGFVLIMNIIFIIFAGSSCRACL